MGTLFGLATLALVFGLSASITDAPKERLPDVHPLAFRTGFVPSDLADYGAQTENDGGSRTDFNAPTGGGKTRTHTRSPEDAVEAESDLIAGMGDAFSGTGEQDLQDDVSEAVLTELEVVPGRRPPPPEPVQLASAEDKRSYYHQVYFDPETGLFRGELPRGVNLQLSRSDVRRYRQIFDLQRDARWAEADRVIARLKDRRLLGHVRFQRLMHPKDYRSSYDELRTWLATYSDHPGADRVYRLAQRRQPAGAAAPERPNEVRAIRGNLESRALWAEKATTATSQRRSRPSGGSYDQARQRVERYLRENAPQGALRLLSSPSVGGKLDPLAYDTLRTHIAAHLYYDGNISTALSLARSSAHRSGESIPYAHWIAGLSAWRLGQYGKAAEEFRSMAADPLLSPWQTAAAAFWGARAYQKLGRVASARRLSQQAARHFRTFYGVIARRGLRMDSGFDWSHPPITSETLELLDRSPGGQRAIGLLQVGRFDAAAQEIQALYRRDDRVLAQGLLTLAVNLRLPDLALTLGNAVARDDGRPFDAALYPVPHWTPRDGFRIDRALIYAFMRQESRFDPNARSYRGAAGLMQLMPSTAQYVSDDGLDYSGQNAHLLYDPGLNMSLGQRYLRYLLRNPAVESNLFMLAAAYNGGPGNLRRWQRDAAISKDPLLFIESIPYRETRQFIEKLLTNFWVYRMRLGQRTPSLDAIAAGRWPVFDTIDERLTQVAQTDE